MGAELLALGPRGEEAVEDRLGLVGRDAGALVLDRRHHAVAVPPGGQRQGAAGRAEGHGVDDDVAEDLAQPPLQAGDGEVLRRQVQHEARTAGAGAHRVHLDQRLQQAAQVDRLGLGARQLGIEARGIGDVGDQAVHAVDVVEDDGQQLLDARRVLQARHGLHRAAQRGQRILDLVRDVGGEALDGVDAGPEHVGHRGQRLAQLADLVAAARIVRQRDLLALAALHLVGGARQRADRPGDGAGEVEREQHGHGQRHAEDHQDVDPPRRHRAVDGAGVLGQQQGAQHLPVALHRHRHVQHQRAVARLARRALLLAEQRREHLGIVGGGLRRAVLVGRQVGGARQPLEQPVDEGQDAIQQIGPHLRRQRVDHDHALLAGELVGIDHQDAAALLEGGIEPAAQAGLGQQQADLVARQLRHQALAAALVGQHRGGAEREREDAALRRHGLQLGLDQALAILLQVEQAEDRDGGDDQVDQQHAAQDGRAPEAPAGRPRRPRGALALGARGGPPGPAGGRRLGRGAQRRRRRRTVERLGGHGGHCSLSGRCREGSLRQR